MYKKQLLLTLLISGLLTLSFSGKKKPTAKSALKVLTGFCSFIPSGTTQVDQESTTVQSFYMSSTEITNFQYAEFLFDLEKNGELEKLAIAAIDTSAWLNVDSFSKSMVDYYHNHPAYHDYPVVNISKEAAELYCTWLTGKYEELSGGELKIIFRIPTRAEWIHAASGGVQMSPYSWGGPYLRGEKGLILANFLRMGAENVARDEESGEFKIVPNVFIAGSSNSDITAPAKSYFPNNYGLYNMNGNVSEMVSDGDLAAGGDWNSPGYDIRNQSIKKFENTDPTVGFRVVATYLEKAK
ncbi:MAG: sulfatase modifying factor 1 [Crocinitomicaceae bacterium]|jgi:sulfatase modifying factor 1